MKRLVVWGGTEGQDSFRWIQKAYHSTARKLGIPTVWVPDHPRSVPAISAGFTVLTADVYGKHLPYLPGVDYVLHNFDGSHPVCQHAADGNLLRLQVWTTAATGEEWDRFRQFDRDARTLFQPWGADLLAEEFLDPVFNPGSRDVTFVGAVWGEKSDHGELGNVETIALLREACVGHGLKFRHLTQVTDAENVAAVRAARVAPAVAGAWQVEHGYLPCRVFKNAAYGVLAFTNVPQANNLMGGAAMRSLDYVPELLDEVLSLSRSRYVNLVREEQRVVARYTYRQSLEAIDRAFAEIKA